MKFLCAGITRVVHSVGGLFGFTISVCISFERINKVWSNSSHQVIDFNWSTEHGGATDQNSTLGFHKNGDEILRTFRISTLEVVGLICNASFEISLLYLFETFRGKIVGEDKDAGISTPLIFSFFEELDIFVSVYGWDPFTNFIFPSVS